MDDSTVQVLGIAIGVLGTLLAAVLTQVLASRAERRRRSADERSRWYADRLRLNSSFLASSLKLERDMWDAASQLDIDGRRVRMPGFTSILLTPEEGIDGVFDAITRDIIVEAVEDAFERLDALEETASEIALVGTPAEIETARNLHEALWDVAGLLESYQSFDSAADAVERARAARDAFAQAARRGLGTSDGPLVLDGRPRRSDQL
ncbi:hypothetical protein [Promicromonospora sp. NPDC050262]|uniref:hypothetical protein n=1 Tax=Promicromonospora sp. NPDC050262 TaxID=3155036 RepID=UPI0033F52464